MSAFLGLEKMETIRRVRDGVEEIELHDIIAVPLRDDMEVEKVCIYICIYAYWRYVLICIIYV